MSGYSVPTREDDPVHTVRTIARIAQMLIELRDEYVTRPRPEILQQIEQRLDDLLFQREELRQRIANAAKSGE
jgi:anti-sigma-K factor RskA